MVLANFAHNFGLKGKVNGTIIDSMTKVLTICSDVGGRPHAYWLFVECSFVQSTQHEWLVDQGRLRIDCRFLIPSLHDLESVIPAL